VACASAAFLIWGFSPIYWRALHPIPPLEIIMHRVIWSFLFLVILLTCQRQWREFSAALTNRRTLSTLIPTTLLVGFNWYIYIWAVNNNHILQASLGYYINPLVNVLLGMIFLRERLRPLQTVSLVMAGIGVLYLAVSYGEFPWIALSLAFAFGLYGLARKTAAVGALVGLSVEMLFLSFPALAYILLLGVRGAGALFRISIKIDLLLMGAALMTAFPLLLFTLGTRRLKLSTVGFLQYIAPTCMFLVGVFFYHEPLHKAQGITFALIWTALCIYSTDSVMYYRQTRPPASRPTQNRI
jgi:chloramphenicol-sensitive protein RarD